MNINVGAAQCPPNEEYTAFFVRNALIPAKEKLIFTCPPDTSGSTVVQGEFLKIKIQFLISIGDMLNIPLVFSRNESTPGAAQNDVVQITEIEVFIPSGSNVVLIGIFSAIAVILVHI